MHDDHRIIDERMEKYGSFLIRLHLKVPLPRRIEESSSRREGRVEKFSSNFAKILILQNTKFKNFAKILWNYKNENFAATLCRSGMRRGGGTRVTRRILF